jgi:glutathione synthase/RimK-type ligase-like ATP-grasp enzyme
LKILVVVDNPAEWPTDLSGVELVAVRTYLSEPARWPARGVTVFNLCRSYRYQGMGWYVSLLAAARGHRPVPSVSNLRDVRSRLLIRTISEDLDALVQRSLASISAKRFELSVYFGRNLAKRHERLSRRLYNLFQVPFLRAQFERRSDRWMLMSVQPISIARVPDSHRDFLMESARSHFSEGRFGVRRRRRAGYELAILHDPDESDPPSDARALARFRKAAAGLGIGATLIGKDDLARLAEYDALFIRTTTRVDDHTYDFAREAEAQGLVVIDDPQSIVRAANKVFLAEVLERNGIPHPETFLASRDNLHEVPSRIGLPCVLKQPDSAFSLGVCKVGTEEELRRKGAELLSSSDLIIAQRFIPTEFDWRVGVIDRQPLYACRYHMARDHWQIMKHSAGGRTSYGKVQAMPVEEAPERIVQLAVKAANLVGDGLYGVDLKSRDEQCYVIEINDNPSLEAGYEDGHLGMELYERIMRVFLDRIVAAKSERTRQPVPADDAAGAPKAG